MLFAIGVQFSDAFVVSKNKTFHTQLFLKKNSRIRKGQTFSFRIFVHGSINVPGLRSLVSLENLNKPAKA